MHIPEKEYQLIKNEIESSASPVGIDAKHTHILIIHKLREIEKRLDRIEQDIRDAGKPG
ncbi:MAG: hypothetical protein WD266_11945 [Balneolales bacterium]